MIVVGTSSWADPGFVEHWYPQGLPSRERLPFYAKRFDAVELNSSFYAIPAAAPVARTLEAFDPLAKTGKLTAFLLQLSPGFDPRHNELDELTPVI